MCVKPASGRNSCSLPARNKAFDILTLFEEINEAGTTVVFATHDHSLLSSSPHRLVVIDDGHFIEASQGLRAWSARTQLSA